MRQAGVEYAAFDSAAGDVAEPLDRVAAAAGAEALWVGVTETVAVEQLQGTASVDKVGLEAAAAAAAGEQDDAGVTVAERRLL